MTPAPILTKLPDLSKPEFDPDNLEDVFVEVSRLFGCSDVSLDAFCPQLAKIAHARCIAQFGLANVRSLLAPLILCTSKTSMLSAAPIPPEGAAVAADVNQHGEG